MHRDGSIGWSRSFQKTKYGSATHTLGQRKGALLESIKRENAKWIG